MKNKRNWAIGIFLTATAAFVALQNGNTSNQTDPPNTTTPIPANGNCAFVWAYHNDLKLSDKINGHIQEMNKKADARASLYGEDCVYADGHSTFGVMETDFYVHLSVEDISAEDAFGNWIAEVMPVIIQIPNDEIQGSHGFVEFWFDADSEDVTLRVPIQKYLDQAQGLAGIELFQLFNNKP